MLNKTLSADAVEVAMCLQAFPEGKRKFIRRTISLLLAGNKEARDILTKSKAGQLTDQQTYEALQAL